MGFFYVESYLIFVFRYEDASRQHWHREGSPEVARHEYEVDVDTDEESTETERVKIMMFRAIKKEL